MNIIHRGWLYEYVKIDDDIIKLSNEAKDLIIEKAKDGEEFEGTFNIKNKECIIKSKLIFNEHNNWGVSGSFDLVKTITIFLTNINKVNQLDTFINEILESLEHEIIHIVNIKTKHIKRYIQPEEDLEKYTLQPTEIDSQIAPIAKRIADDYKEHVKNYEEFGKVVNNYPIPNINEYISNNKNQTINYLKTNKNIWNKFLKEVYWYVRN